jgi:hypothetical protein
MWRAARGALADSIWYYLDWPNVLLMMSVLAVAALAPRLFDHVPTSIGTRWRRSTDRRNIRGGLPGISRICRTGAPRNRRASVWARADL